MTPQSDEDEVWRQIVASYNETPDNGSADQPWPDRENVAAVPATETADPEPAEIDDSEQSDGDGAGQTRTDEDNDHYVPPPPDPLPKTDALTKASWLALFGGPAYLLLAALLSWPMDPWIVFAAVAAFIGGFVTLVVRMGDGPPNDSGWDDGAVV
ncbi:hypothetical protein Aph01nite_13590 [Acrocarpospora phusangensis]|uniref:DUF308 domain-containing protein n=1 Tax=Acrocarpospora phusangensis TaxID=1070424 RepID=A0A919Q8A8_9ACTN|nr:hypothetical protein [Acrocarpospora phusangensis]GIH23049.1 hypothetical protein Aph01nite_13590 [Acrocarpospora phusangensis]